MKTIKIINMYGHERQVTLLKVYEVVSEAEEYYRIKNDEGYVGSYPKEWFEKYEEVIISKQEYDNYRDTLEWIKANGDKQSAAMARITLSNYKNAPAPAK